MSYSKVTELIQLWGEFESIHPTPTFVGFGQWLSTRESDSGPNPSPEKKKKDYTIKWKSHEDGLKHHQQKETTVQIGMLLGRLSKFGRFYSKKVLSPLNLNLDEFGFLATILHMESPRKSDVIHINLFEPTSGTEILRRLIQLGYVKEQANKNDKRSKTLKITALGEKTIYKAFEAMRKVGKLTSANLSEKQKEEMISIMDYLNDFHVNLYLNHKEDSVEDCIEKFITKPKL